MPPNTCVWGPRNHCVARLRLLIHSRQPYSEFAFRSNSRGHQLPSMWRAEYLRRNQLCQLRGSGHQRRRVRGEQLSHAMPRHTTCVGRILSGEVLGVYEDRTQRELIDMQITKGGQIMDDALCGGGTAEKAMAIRPAHSHPGRLALSRRPSSWATPASSTVCHRSRILYRRRCTFILNQSKDSRSG